jgi:hypothetical protein
VSGHRALKRPVPLVLLLTFVGLVVATLWVPCNNLWLAAPGPLDGLHWRWIENAFAGRTYIPPPDESRFGIVQLHRLSRPVLALEYALIIAIGGSLALAVHLRSRRTPGDAT